MVCKKILITGVAGMIGSHFLDKIINMDFKIVGIDDLSVGRIENIRHNLSNENFTFYQTDVLDYNTMKNTIRNVDVVLHLAATKKIGEKGDGIKTLRTNTLGTENCLRIALESGSKLIFASTSDVYGMSADLPLREDADILLGPSMIKRWSYAVSKLYSEQLCFAYYKDYNVPIVILRYCGGFSHRASFSWSGGHIPIFIDQILKDEPVTIHGDGSQTRSMGSVLDLVEGTYLAMTNEKAIGEIFNIGNNNELSVIDSARLIHRLANTGNELKIKYIPMNKIFGKYKDIQRRVPDLSKAYRGLSYKPTISLEDAIKMTIKEKRKSNFQVQK